MRVEGRIGFAPALSDKRCRIDPQSPVWRGPIRPPQPRFAPCGLRLAPQALTRSSGPAGGSARIDGSIRLARRRGRRVAMESLRICACFLSGQLGGHVRPAVIGAAEAAAPDSASPASRGTLTHTHHRHLARRPADHHGRGAGGGGLAWRGAGRGLRSAPLRG